jgi:hypothetical protein
MSETRNTIAEGNIMHNVRAGYSGAEHQNIYNKAATLIDKGAAHRNIMSDHSCYGTLYLPPKLN